MQKAVWFFGGVLAVVVVASVWLGLALAPDRRQVTVIGGGFQTDGLPMPAPDISFSDGAGNRLTLEAFRGQVVLVNLWATWCAPCVEEMPSLDRLQARLGGENFMVLPLSIDRQGAVQVRPFYDKLGIAELGIYLDPKGEALRAFGTLGLPTSYLIDRGGRVVGSYAGAKDWDSDASIAELRRYIGN